MGERRTPSSPPDHPAWAATGPERWATLTDPVELASALLDAKGAVHRHELTIARLDARLAVARAEAVQLTAGAIVDRLASAREAARSTLAEARVDVAVLTRLVAAAATLQTPPRPVASAPGAGVPAAAPPADLTAAAKRRSQGLLRTLLVVALAGVLVGTSTLVPVEPRRELAWLTDRLGSAGADIQRGAVGR